MRQLVIIQIGGPEFITLRVASEGCLILFKLGQLDVLQPIFIVERERF
jgi:hypothetical protein